VHAPSNARADSVDGEDELERFERELLPLMDDAYTLARHLTRDPHDAQDMVQEAYLRALRYFATYLGGDARAWFLTIVRHCCFTLHRRRQTAAELDLDAVPGVVAAPPAYAADDRALARDRRETIDRALATLPPVFREAIVLRDVHGLSYRENARIAGVPDGTEMTRHARARKRPQEALGWASREAS
jgi:RNA polymerase sigma-70 factor (ECF subfamily)